MVLRIRASSALAMALASIILSALGAAPALAQCGGPFQLVAPDAAPSDQFGSSVAISGDTLIFGAPYDDGAAGADQGSAYVYRWNGSAWAFEAKLTASDAAANDTLGYSVALSGDTAFVGAANDDGPGGTNQGSAYIFTRSGTIWTEQAKLTASDAAANDAFGNSVALSGDTAVVGAAIDDGPGGINQGSAYIFTRSSTIWTQQAKLTASDAATNDAFGSSVALSGDIAVVGAGRDDAPSTDQGSAYIFTRSGSSWTQQAKLTASDGAAADLFGLSVAVSGDTAVVGADLDNGAAGSDQGSAYIFTRSGSSWTQQAKLTASDAAAGDRFGWSVALSGDTAIVGAPADDGPAGVNQGSAHIFSRSGAVWSAQAIVTTSDAAATFGIAVALSGGTAIVGAYQDDLSGSATVFHRTGDAWHQSQQRVIPTDAAASDRFGSAIAFSGDTVIVGATGDDGPGGLEQGSAYVFTNSAGSWSYQATLRALEASAPSAHFGNAVGVDGDTAIIGAPLDDAFSRGAAYVFTRTGTVWSQQQRLSAGLGEAGLDNQFGTTVAISGDTAFVGMPLDDDTAGVNQGSVYIFTRSGSVWTRQLILTPSDAGAGARFGSAIALESGTAVIGALYDSPGGTSQGSVYIFTGSGATWTQQAKLIAPDGAYDDQFGASVALSGDSLIIGAPGDDGSMFSDGSAYIFTRAGMMWAYQTKLTAGDAGVNERFGSAVALSGDRAIVGANLEDGPGGTVQGSVYVFTRAGSNTQVWTQQAKLTAADGAADDRFGNSVALAGDVAMVGAQSDDGAAGADQGAVYIDFIGPECSTVTFNTTTGTAHANLSSAISAAVTGHSLLADAGAFATTSTLDTFGRGLSMTSRRGIVRPFGSSTVLSGGSDLAAASGEDVSLFGALTVSSGSCAVSGASLITSDGTNVEVRPESDLALLVPEVVLNGTVLIWPLALLSSTAAIRNANNLALQGSLLAGVEFENLSGVDLYEASEIACNATNRGTIMLHDDSTIDGDFFNASGASTLIANGVLTVTGTVTNLGDISGPLVEGLAAAGTGSAIVRPDGTDFGSVDLAAQARASAVRLTIQGDYIQTGPPPGGGTNQSGSLRLSMSGSAQSPLVDCVAIAGQATLGGRLIVDRFTPPGAITQPLTILTSDAGITGFFDVAFLPPVGEQRKFFRADAPVSAARGVSASVVLTIEDLATLIHNVTGDADDLDGRPSAAALGDFDGASGLDIAIALRDSTSPTTATGDVIVLYNNGSTGSIWNGWSIGAAQYAVGVNPSGIAAAELDGAPGLDLVISNEGDDNVLVLVNNGAIGAAQSFASAGAFSVGDAPSAAVARDLDLDGLADVAVSNSGSDSVSLLQNRGVVGTWQGLGQTLGTNRVDLALPILAAPRDLCVTQLNAVAGDELAVANTGIDSITIISNDPTLRAPWGFRFTVLPTSIPTGARPTSIEPINPDEDKWDDLATANAEGGSISVLLNDTDGPNIGFRPHVEVPVGDDPSSLVEIDIDNDGDKDLAVVAQVSGARTVRILRNDAPQDGVVTLSPDNNVSSAPNPLLVLAGNVNASADATVDLIVLSDESLTASAARGVPPAECRVILNALAPPCAGDADGSGSVNFNDVLVTLANFGADYGELTGPGDADHDGIVNFSDVLATLANFGTLCP